MQITNSEMSNVTVRIAGKALGWSQGDRRSRKKKKPNQMGMSLQKCSRRQKVEASEQKFAQIMHHTVYACAVDLTYNAMRKAGKKRRKITLFQKVQGSNFIPIASI